MRSYHAPQTQLDEFISMRRRLTPPSFPVFIISVILAGLAIASMFTNIPVIGHYLAGPHRFWALAIAYAILFIGVVFDGL